MNEISDLERRLEEIAREREAILEQLQKLRVQERVVVYEIDEPTNMFAGRSIRQASLFTSGR